MPFACSSSRPPCRPPQLVQTVPVGPRSHLLANYSCQPCLPPLPSLDSTTGLSVLDNVYFSCQRSRGGRRFCKKNCTAAALQSCSSAEKVLRKVRIVGLAVSGRSVASCNAVVGGSGSAEVGEDTTSEGHPTISNLSCSSCNQLLQLSGSGQSLVKALTLSSVVNS